jgi:hypothetical protein
VDDAVTRYCAASEANDVDAMVATMAPDVELNSPLVGRMTFKGRDDVGELLGKVYATLTDLRWGQPLGQASERVAISDAKVAGLRITDAMVFDLSEDGHIRRIRPHLRPWLATTVFALMLGPKVARRFGIVVRALRSS